MKNDGKLICRVNPFNSGFIWVILDEPIQETNTVVESFYPTATYKRNGELLKLSFETMHHLDQVCAYKAHSSNISVIYSPGESKQRVIDMLREYKEDAIKSNDYSPKTFYGWY